MSTSTVKICVVGPQEGGKTLLCKLLAEQLPADRGYYPTKGLRIQEVERIGPGGIAVNVQLRDCSGDFGAYSQCFPAMALDMDGLIVVYDPDEEGKEPELERWHEAFSTVGDARLAPSQCLVARRSAGTLQVTASDESANPVRMCMAIGAPKLRVGGFNGCVTYRQRHGGGSGALSTPGLAHSAPHLSKSLVGADGKRS